MTTQSIQTRLLEITEALLSLTERFTSGSSLSADEDTQWHSLAAEVADIRTQEVELSAAVAPAPKTHRTLAWSAGETIPKLDRLQKAITDGVDQLAMQIRQCRERWENLGRVGGKRDDSAAEYLRDVRRAVLELAETAQVITAQLDEVIADPFGDERAEGRKPEAGKLFV